jgi:hypothetical protein
MSDRDPASELRAAISAALEALEAGDQREACSILLAALEAGPSHWADKGSPQTDEPIEEAA